MTVACSISDDVLFRPGMRIAIPTLLESPQSLSVGRVSDRSGRYDFEFAFRSENPIPTTESYILVLLPTSQFYLRCIYDPSEKVLERWRSGFVQNRWSISP